MFGEPKNSPDAVSFETAFTIRDDLRKPINDAVRSEMHTGQLYPYYGANGQVDSINDYLMDCNAICLAEDCGAYGAGEHTSYIVSGKCWVNNHAHILTGKIGHSPETLYILLSNTPVKSIVTGAVQPKISQANLKSIPIVIAPREQILKYKELIDPLFAKVRENHDESNRLFILRDTLLPKLMSGEIDVSEVEI